MVIETMIISLLVGKLRGGKIKNIENLDVRGWYLFVLSFLIEIISLLIMARFDNSLSYLITDYFSYIHIFIYLLLIVGLVMNWTSIGLRVTLFGSILNFLPIVMNSGKMPVSIDALIYSKQYTQLSLLEEGRIMTHALASDGSKLLLLGDIIPIPKPYIFPKIISLGDILISLGIFILIQIYMKERSWNI